MTKTKRDEVLNPRRYEISNCDSDPIVDACAFGGDWIKSTDFERLKSLYLAQEEELEKVNFDAEWIRKGLEVRVESLLAENQALKAKMQKAYSDINNWIYENG